MNVPRAMVARAPQPPVEQTRPGEMSRCLSLVALCKTSHPILYAPVLRNLRRYLRVAHPLLAVEILDHLDRRPHVRRRVG
jgi:hypothetical protein